MPVGLVSPWLVDGGLLTGPHMVVSLCTHPWYPSYKNTNQIGLGPTQTTSFKLNYLFKDSISMQSHSVVLAGGVVGSVMNLGRDTVLSITAWQIEK